MKDADYLWKTDDPETFEDEYYRLWAGIVAIAGGVLVSVFGLEQDFKTAMNRCLFAVGRQMIREEN